MNRFPALVPSDMPTLDELILASIATPKPLRVIASEIKATTRADVARALRRLKSRGLARCNLITVGVPCTYWQATNP